jgi:hypothetical protein
MVPDISSIIARKYGMSKQIMQCRNKTMEATEHHIRTSHGDSETYYKNSPGDIPMSGEFQGKGDVATLFALESQTILNTHRDMTTGIDLPHVYDPTIRISKNNDAFVDDNDGSTAVTGANFRQCEQRVMTKTEENGQIYTDLTDATGGAIAHHKTVVQSACHDDSFPPKLKNTPDTQISLRDRYGVPTKIQNIPVSCPIKGLGCRIAVDASMHGTSEHEFEARLEQCQSIANRCARAKLTPEEANMIMRPRVMPSVGYSAAVTRFTPVQCQKLNSTINQVLLPKMKINRKMPLAVIYAPLKLGGLNWPSFEIKQDTDSIMTMIKHMRQDTTMATDIKVTLSAWQLVSGLCTPFLEPSTETLDFLGPGWIHHMRQRLQNINAKIWLEDQWTPRILRSNDSSIMSKVLQLRLSRATMQKFNYVRLYLRIITIADLADETGAKIPGHRFTGRWQANSTLTWPDIPQPPSSLMALFRSIIRKAYATTLTSKHTNDTITLAKHLGPWNSNKNHINYTAYRTAIQVFIRHDNAFHVFYAQNARTFVYNHTSATIPDTTHPTIATIDQNTVYTHFPYNKAPTQWIPKAPRHEVCFPSSTPAHSCSDGSVDITDGSRAAAYALHTGKHTIMGSMNFPPSDYSTSYRSELEGIYLLSQTIHRHKPPIHKQACDNEKAIQRVEKTLLNPTRMLDPEADLILAIKYLRHQTKYPSTLKWMKGHTDDNKKYEDLEYDYQTQIDMDTLAKHSRTHDTVTHQTPYPGSKALLIIDNKWITTEYCEQIQEAITKRKHKQYFLGRHPHLGPEDYNTIDFRGIGIARKKHKLRQTSRITKYMNGWLNVGHQKIKMKQNGQCPCCGITDETQMHLFHCNNPDMIRAKNLALRSFSDHLISKGLPAKVLQPFLALIKNYTANTTNPATISNQFPYMKQTIELQEHIGPEATLRGYLHKGWMTEIKRYTNHKVDRKRNAMLNGLWSFLFYPIWEQRNNILHIPNNIVTITEHRTLNEELIDWKRHHRDRLHTCQYHLTDYTDSDLDTWTIPHKHNTIKLLRTSHKNYMKHIKRSGLQTLITKYMDTNVTQMNRLPRGKSSQA